MTAADYIPLRLAYLCENCKCVGNQAEQCPACGDRNGLLSLATVLDREECMMVGGLHPTMRPIKPGAGIWA